MKAKSAIEYYNDHVTLLDEDFIDQIVMLDSYGIVDMETFRKFCRDPDGTYDKFRFKCLVAWSYKTTVSEMRKGGKDE